MKATNKPEANVIQQPSENPRDGFLDYLSDTAEVGILSTEKFLVDTPEMIYDLASKANMLPTGQVDRAITEATGITPFKRMQKQLGFENIPSNILKEKIDGLNQRIQDKSKDYGGDPLSAIEQGRYSDAAKLIAGSTLQSAPMMAISIGTGGGSAALASIGVLTASGKYQENLQNKELSQNERLLNAAGSGVLESTLGHFFSGASGAVAKRILKDKGVEVGSKILSNSFRRFAEKNIMKSPVIGLVGEVLEETAVEGGNQLNDFSVGIRKEFDGRSAINAGLSAIGLGGTNTVSVYGAKAYMSANKYSQIKKTNKAIARLQNEINNEGISEESKKIFQVKSEELIANNKRALGEEIEKLKTLSTEDKALLKKTNSIIDEVSISIDNIKEDKTLSPEAKRIATAEIYKDYIEAAKVKRGILSKLKDVKVEGDFTDFTGVPLDFDIETIGVASLPIDKQSELNKKALEELNTELNPTGMEQVDITKDMVSKRASELYEKETEAVQPIQEDIVSTPVSEEVIKQQEEDTPFVEEPVKEDVIGDDLLLSHGSPHDFDKFQLEKIGTGEGAQAFGYGLYFTDGSKIAESYAKKLSEDETGVVYNVRIKNGAKKEWVEWREPLDESKDSELYNSLTDSERKQYESHLEKAFYPESKNYDPKYEKDYHGAFDELKTDDSGFKMEDKQSSVGRLYSDLKDAFGQAKATEIFKRVGIDGIKYRAGKGYGENYNYVVFDPTSIVIEKKSNESDKATEEKKETTETKTQKEDINTNAVDVFKAGLEAIKITKETSKAKLKSLTDTVNSLVQDVNGKPKNGSVTVKQANAIIKRIGSLNLDNPKTTDKLIEYVTNIVNNAEYKDKLDNLDSTISGIKSKIKSKSIDPELKDLAKKFVSIKPKNVDDIDTYFDIADNINKNISGSTTRGSRLNIAEGIDKAKLAEYIDRELEQSKSLDIQEVMNSFYENTGLKPSDFSYDEIQEMMYEPDTKSEKFNKYDELSLKDKIRDASVKMKSIVKDMIQNRINSFSFERIYIDESKKSEFKRILDVDVDKLSKQDSLLYIDILNDIIVNGDSNKLTLFNTKIDANNTAKEATKTFSAKKVRLFGINSLARAWNEQIASLPLVSESMFKSIEKGEEFLNVIGFDNIRKGTNKATREVNTFFKGVSDKYSKTKPNGEDFTSKFNDAERGMSAFMIMSTDDSDFNRNKSLVEQSINNLSKGDESQREMAKVHKSVYDKILADSKSIDDVTSKADKLNVDVVNEFIEFNDSKYSDKENVSKSIYNSSLDNKKNYTPISYKKISSKNVKMDDIDAFDSSILSSKEKVYDKKSGTFIESKKPATVKSDSYISFDFLSDNERKMKESLVDTYTAKDIQFMKSFIESPYMEEIIPDLKDREVFVDRIKDYVKIKRNRQVDTAPEAAKAFSKFIDKTSRLAVARSLGGVGQALNQTIPVATSTLINSQRLDIIDATNKDWNSLIDNSGYDIANRGLESSSDYAAFSKILQQSSEGNFDKAIDLLSKGQELWLKTFLGKPDVFIARASWISFYKKGLEQQGLSTDVDPKTHEINEQAARYAQAQVDRQQNPSDPSLEGKWLSSKNSGTKISRAIILPFAKFALNQKTRMYNDARILSSISSSTQDKSKSALSLIGLAAEMAVFGYVSGYIRDLIESGVDYAMGYEEDEEDKKKMDKQKKERAILSFTSNVISPFPLVDFAFQELVGQGLDLAQDYYEIPKEDKINVKPFSDSGINKFGTLGITAQVFSDIPQYEKLVYDGKFKDRGGREKQISDKDLENLRALRLPFYLNQAGILPREVSYAIKKAVKVSKERAGDADVEGSSPKGNRF
jgi:hypothetical protein